MHNTAALTAAELAQLKSIKKMIPVLWLMFKLDRPVEVKDIVEGLSINRETASNYLKQLASPEIGLIARTPGKKRGYILTRGRNLITPGGHQFTIEAEINTIQIAENPRFGQVEDLEIAENPAFQPLSELSEIEPLFKDQDISLNYLKDEIAEKPRFGQVEDIEIAVFPRFENGNDRPRTRWVMWHGQPRRLHKNHDGTEQWLDDDAEEDARLQQQHAELMKRKVYRHLADKLIHDFCSVEIAIALEVYDWSREKGEAKHAGFLINFLYKNWFIPYGFHAPHWPEAPGTEHDPETCCCAGCTHPRCTHPHCHTELPY